MSLEPTNHRPVNLDQENLLHRIIDRIRRSLELKDILQATAVEVGEFLGTDRIKIYQFQPDGNGQVVAESIQNDRLPSLLGLTFPADDIPLHARELFTKTRTRSIVNVDTQEIGQSALEGVDTSIAFADLEYRSVDPCHVEYLTAMGVISSVVMPLLVDDQLWGLFVSHHSEAREIPEVEVRAVQLVVDQLSVAIAQSTLTTQARAKATQEAAINRITCLLHSLSTIELQAALDETVTALQGSGGRLWIRPEALEQYAGNRPSDTRIPTCSIQLYTNGVQPQIPAEARYPLMEQYSVWKEFFKSVEQSVWEIQNLYKEPGLRNLQFAFRSTPIRGILIVPLWYRHQLLGYLTVFRDEIETEILWAGQVDPDRRQRPSQLSFEVWKESKRGQAQPWTTDEIEMLQTLGKQFATAIQQYEMHQHLQTLNARLEIQVEERTAQLKQATEQQQILFEVVTKMRQSLDLDTIFKTLTQEVRRSLAADRVGVYRFDPSSQFNEGEFIAEDVSPEFPSALSTKIQNQCFGESYATLYRNGGFQALADLQATDRKDCCAILDQFHVKALLTAPLLRGNQLWGLLCIHQCDRPRVWKSIEIQFATQVAAQLGVALEQADLLAQTQNQTEQLKQTLHDLRKTQNQLVQTEKMSSLGQLVAGVAHEINNPVNFIYGNLNHVNDYARDLLKLVETYQAHCSRPSAQVSEQLEAIDLDFLSQDLPKTLSSMKVGAERIRQIVLSLRNFSRLDQAEMKLVDIHEGLESTLLILQHRLKAKTDTSGIELVKEYGDLPKVECYAGQLNQVFMNVLSNAIDALEEAESQRSRAEVNLTQTPTIRIRTERLGSDRVLICIGDNGLGIPENLKLQVFDAFFTTKPIGKGTGMGLSISYEIVVEKHGGVFRCSSQPDRGTEFWIEIPIRP